jgi:hypothetical protein
MAQAISPTTMIDHFNSVVHIWYNDTPDPPDSGPNP